LARSRRARALCVAIDQSGQVLGLQAARLVIQRLTGRKSPEHFVIQPRLVVRNSSAGAST
jgi:DNA-binding LacI/PurR family transcriptional regulator